VCEWDREKERERRKMHKNSNNNNNTNKHLKWVLSSSFANVLFSSIFFLSTSGSFWVWKKNFCSKFLSFFFSKKKLNFPFIFALNEWIVIFHFYLFSFFFLLTLTTFRMKSMFTTISTLKMTSTRRVCVNNDVNESWTRTVVVFFLRIFINT
jgi:hypothetical protein